MANYEVFVKTFQKRKAPGEAASVHRFGPGESVLILSDYRLCLRSEIPLNSRNYAAFDGYLRIELTESVAVRVICK